MRDKAPWPILQIPGRYIFNVISNDIAQHRPYTLSALRAIWSKVNPESPCWQSRMLEGTAALAWRARHTFHSLHTRMYE